MPPELFRPVADAIAVAAVHPWLVQTGADEFADPRKDHGD
jgi:hypothetical protein